MRVGARFVALAAFIAIGAIALIIAVAGSGHSGTMSRSGSPSLSSVQAPLTPQERHYVLGIASLNDAQIAAAFGTGR